MISTTTTDRALIQTHNCVGRRFKCIRFIHILTVAAAIVLTVIPATRAIGQQGDTPLTVGIYESPPFVMYPDDQSQEGLAIDLWNELADRLERESTFVRFETFGDLTRAVESGQIDVAVTNLTITEDRHARMDFTQPWFDAGLRIMVMDEGATGLRALINGLADAGHLRAYGWLALVILIATFAFTVFDRRFDKDFHPRWRDGMAHSFYSVMQIATSGKMAARKNLFGWIGRIGQALWLIVGIAVVAYITSSVVSVMTTLAITDQINSPEDLPGQRIGVFEGSIAQEFGQVRGYNLRSYSGIAGAVAHLTDGRIDAIVADAPVLEYFAISNPDMNLNVVGPIFEPDRYGFALPLDSDLTRDLSNHILALWEDGTIRALDTDYFGHEW
ncbi:transporter substrate-binding domain-containing protein [Hasllibacter sp. MH4015]|uniref:transporter substrate-binding domain-containing protein n=1 Tax=Hasllibacter sp. MH4015 TaxID=2854029 RepID=UPI001CD550A5|nr:transporter substrate-binding domain-containing protein [Hasllibacter sp. MH4015]